MCLGNDVTVITPARCHLPFNPRSYGLCMMKEELARLPQIFSENNLYLVWSLKEAAYKCCHHHNSEKVFSPLDYHLLSLDAGLQNRAGPILSQSEYSYKKGFPAIGVVNARLLSYTGVILYGRALLLKDMVISVVVSAEADFSEVCWGLNRIAQSGYNHQSKQVRQLAAKHIYSQHPHLNDQLCSFTSLVGGCPVYTLARQPGIISFSHDDQFVFHSFFTLFYKPLMSVCHTITS